MSGYGTFLGTTYQQKVGAIIGVHILAQRPLKWLALHDDTPLAYDGETGGGGDDMLVVLRSGSVIEAQAKHKLGAGKALTDAVLAVQSRMTTRRPVVLVVDRESTEAVYTTFRLALERMRSGRTDDLGPHVEDLATAGVDTATFEVLRVAVLDLGDPGAVELKLAAEMLSKVLARPEQTEAAMAVLATDAGDVAANRSRRSGNDLKRLLELADIALAPSAPDNYALEQLALACELDSGDEHGAALAVIDGRRLRGSLTDLSPSTRFEISHLRAALLVALERPKEALAAALQALDVVKDAPEGMARAAVAAVHAGEGSMAVDLARKALAAGPHVTRCWTCAAIVESKLGGEWPAPPPDVASTELYRTSTAIIAAQRGDWGEVMRLTDLLFAAGDTTDHAYFLRAQALAARMAVPGSDASAGAQRELARVAGLAVDKAEQGHRSLIPKALILRAHAWSRLGKLGAAQVDLERATRLDPQDADVLRFAALERWRAQDPAGALDLLQHPVVESSVLALCFRAFLRRSLRDGAGALRDFERALVAASEASPSEPSARLAVIDAAIENGRLDVAERLLAALPVEIRESGRGRHLGGAIAFGHGDIDAGNAEFEAAVALIPEHRDDLLEELANRLARARRPLEAVAVFKRLPTDAIDGASAQNYASVLMELERFADLAVLLDSVSCEPMPAWEIRARATLELRREEFASAEPFLREMAQRGIDGDRVLLHLAHVLVELSRLDEAAKFLRQLVGSKDLVAVDRAFAAKLLCSCGEWQAGVNQAFVALRKDSRDPRLYQVFATLAIQGEEHRKEQVDTSGEGTYLRLVQADGTARHVVIYSDQWTDPARHEFTLERARTLGYVGKRVGDVIVEAEGSRAEKRWTVQKVGPAWVWLCQDVFDHYEDHFPDGPYFVEKHKIGDGLDAASIRPLLDIVEERRETINRALAHYAKEALPLGAFAGILGTTSSEFMGAVVANADVAGPLRVEWPDPGRHAEAVALAGQAKCIVLTRSAIQTLGMLDAFELLAHYDVTLPRAVQAELRRDLAKAEQTLQRGSATVAAGGPSGLRMQRLDAGHPALQAHVRHLQTALDWISAHGRVLPRSFAALGDEYSDIGDLERVVGRADEDALILAIETGAPLLCDDLGLRRVPVRGNMVHGFSSVALLEANAAGDDPNAKLCQQKLNRLAAYNYSAIAPTFALLDLALRQEFETGRDAVAAAFKLVITLSVLDAGRLVAEVLRAHALDGLRKSSFPEAVRLALRAVGDGCPAAQWCRAVTVASTSVFALLPVEMHVIEQECSNFIRQDLLQGVVGRH